MFFCPILMFILRGRLGDNPWIHRSFLFLIDSGDARSDVQSRTHTYVLFAIDRTFDWAGEMAGAGAGD